MRFLVWLAALALSACAFTSEAPFFQPREAVYPISDGATLDFADSGGEVTPLTFHQAAAGGYGVIDASHADEPMEVLFIAIAETPEDDYILQVQLERGDSSRAYAFMWREGEGFRMVMDPGILEPSHKILVGLDTFCTWRPYRECTLRTREDLLTLYRNAIYPRFVVGNESPGSFATLAPHGIAAPK